MESSVIWFSAVCACLLSPFRGQVCPFERKILETFSRSVDRRGTAVFVCGCSRGGHMQSIRFRKDDDMIQPYLAEWRLSARQPRNFGLACLIGNYLIKALQVLFLLLLWRSLFKNGGVNGMTLEQTLQYTLCSAALAPLLDVRTPAGSWLHDGAIASRCLRPMTLHGQLAADALGAATVPVLIYAPLCLLAGLIMGVNPAPRSLWFFPSLLLCMTQGYIIDLLYACVIIRVGNLSWQVHGLRSALNVLFTGGLIPFAALPWGLGRWLALSPLGTLAGAPLSLYAGLASPLEILPAQILWNLILWPLILRWFNRSMERLVSFGG